MPQVPFSVTTDYMHATAEGCVRVVAVPHIACDWTAALIIGGNSTHDNHAWGMKKRRRKS